MTETTLELPTADNPAVLVQGDALDVLRRLDFTIDAVITDPPYSSGGQFRGDRNASAMLKYVRQDTNSATKDLPNFTGDNRDQRAYLAWCSLWMSACHNAAAPGAVLCCFSDWRQVPTLSDAIQCGGWVWRNLCTWWKPGVRMQRGRFSSSAEFVLYGSKGVPRDGIKSPQNVLACAPVDGDDKEHIAEKPTEVMNWILGVTNPGDIVLDPFMGSGTTGIACIATGRLFVGIELDPAHYETARRRIDKAIGIGGLFAPPVAASLFAEAVR